MKKNNLFKGRGFPGARAAALGLLIAAALVSGGCLVGNDDYDKARLERDEYRDKLVRLHESNDSLKREVAEVYESCDLISNQLTVMAALNIHDRYTANLGRPILPPPLPAAAATPPARTTRPPRAVRTSEPSSGQQQSTVGRTGSSGSGSRQSSGSGRTGSSGGTRTSPPPTPPANSGGGGGGSIDWGF